MWTKTDRRSRIPHRCGPRQTAQVVSLIVVEQDRLLKPYPFSLCTETDCSSRIPYRCVPRQTAQVVIIIIVEQDRLLKPYPLSLWNKTDCSCHLPYRCGRRHAAQAVSLIVVDPEASLSLSLSTCSSSSFPSLVAAGMLLDLYFHFCISSVLLLTPTKRLCWYTPC